MINAGVMEKRKALESEETTEKKRRRLTSEGVPDPTSSPKSPPASFDSLNNDCLVNVLSCLSNEEMNNLAIVNKICREARSNESLDQTRTGLIVLRKGATHTSICNAITRGGWDTFAGNRTSLTVENVENLSVSFTLFDPNLVTLDGVFSLALSGEFVNSHPITLSSFFFPNSHRINNTVSSMSNRTEEKEILDDL